MRSIAILTMLGLLAAPVVFAPADAAARIYPAWSVDGSYSTPFDPGFVSVAGNFEFPLAGATATVQLNYDEKARVSGGGVAPNFTLYSLAGGFTVDPVTREQHLHLADPEKKSLFTFDGVVAAAGDRITGPFHRSDRYLDLPGAESGTLTLQRTGLAAQTQFKLVLATRMDDHGRVRGSLAGDGKSETRAKLLLYGGRVLDSGKIKGLVKTDATGYTTCRTTIVGPRWKVTLTGPVDADGFHASCAVKAAGFVVPAAPLLLSVRPGPTAPPGPPPPAPRNLLPNATATIVNGQVTITHTDVPSKFFGAAAGLTITFPVADGLATVPVDMTTASTMSPRRVIVNVSGKTYATGTAPVGNGSTLVIRKISTVRDGVIEVLATGRIYPVSGKAKSVNVLVQAIVQ